MPTNLAAAVPKSAAALLSSSLKRKEDGNRFFAKKRYTAAVACYRSGLEDLPPYDKNNKAAVVAVDDIINLEVGLRSNIALAILKLTETASAGVEDETQKREHYLQVEQECSIALQLEEDLLVSKKNPNPKLFHRRGMARQRLAEQLQLQHNQQIGNDVDNDGEAFNRRLDELWRLAEEDFSRSVQILQEEQQQLQQQQRNSKDNAMSKKQLGDACEALENLHVAKKKSRMIFRREQQQQQLQQQSSSFVPQQTLSNGHTTEEQSTIEDAVAAPSPQVQKKVFLQLLSRYSSTLNTTPAAALSGEAYFLINMEWWQSWCCYVGLFSMYTTSEDKGGNNNNNNVGMSQPAIERHCKQIDTSNGQILQLLPRGATLPPYLEQDRNEALRLVNKEEEEKKKSSSGGGDSSSSTSSEDSDDDEFTTLNKTFRPPPGVIDNSSLILPPNNEGWCCTIESSHNEQQPSSKTNQGGGRNNDDDGQETSSPSSSVLLRSHLVRGYHFELLPREAYGALRTWYGEISPHIVRRVVVMNDDVAAGSTTTNNISQCVELYSDHWDIFFRRTNQMMKQRSSGSSISSSSSGSKTAFKCSACGSPTGKSVCRKCGVARYCDRECQVNHWPYHKKLCSKLNKQRDQGGSGLETKSSSHVLDSAWGRVGLNNLGNTCFLNSAVQCMMHVAPLTRYFLSGRYSADINNHNILGTGGKVANAYSAVLKDLWMGSHQYQNVSPTALKRAIELFAPQFSGASQQDSAELITYLLDALHEDLNRVKNPPYVEMPDVDLRRKLSISGAEAWQLSCLRNDSFVYDNFYGLYKSKCVCPLCNKVTVKFDPFNHITLEIPQQPLRHIAVLLIRDCVETGPELPTKYCVSFPHTSTVNNLKERLSEVSGTPLARLNLCGVNVDEHRCKQIYENNTHLISEIPQRTMMVAYETHSLDDKTQIHCFVTHYAIDSNLVDVGGMNRRPIGIPILLSFDASLSCAQIFDRILTYVISFAHVDSSRSISKEALKSNLRLRVESHDGLPTEHIISPDATEALPAIFGNGCTDAFIFFALEWVDVVNWGSSGSSTQIHWANFNSTKSHPSYVEHEKKLSSSNPTSVSLYECFESFTQPERLDDENMLYCSGCKKHVQAMKTVTLWRIPKILVVHLKRFEYRGTFNRSKIGVLVDFPLDGLDLDSNCPQSASEDDFVDDRVPLMYDLFGVVNHYGRMGYGHYTAHARRWDETGLETTWAEFDDENVTDVANTDSIVSPAAYVLFYKRRLFL